MEITQQNQGYQQSFRVVKDAYSQIQEMVRQKMKSAALSMALELFNEEVEELCGKRFSRKGEERCHRGGSDDGRILVHGQRVKVKKPRVRSGDEEVQLTSYSALNDYDLLCDDVMKHMIAGVSTRDYNGLLEEISGGTGLKKSSVSRAFVKGSKQSLDEINSRDLSKYEFVSVMIDGIEFGSRCVIAALGITIKGEKRIIGLREGDTENSDVCKDLLTSFFDRGLNTVIPPLFVIDGAKALKKAIRSVFGSIVPIQRCVRHKERNILSYLPKSYHQEFRRRWKKLHGLVDYKLAEKDYDDLVVWLSRINHAACQSLEEAEMETLTAVKLKVPGQLRKTLLSTNPIESAFSMASSKKIRVKNWKSGENQISRWAAVTLLEAERRFRAVRGYQQIPTLVGELRNLILENKVEVA